MVNHAVRLGIFRKVAQAQLSFFYAVSLLRTSQQGIFGREGLLDVQVHEVVGSRGQKRGLGLKVWIGSVITNAELRLAIHNQVLVVPTSR